VAELAHARPDDVQAILRGLEGSHQSAIEALLAGYAGIPAAPAKEVVIEATAAPGPAEDWTKSGLSPWLMEKLTGEPTPVPRFARGQKDSAMTPAALVALRAAAEPFRTAAAPAKERATPRPILLSHIQRRLGRRK
jgi:hypothetical protein